MRLLEHSKLKNLSFHLAAFKVYYPAKNQSQVRWDLIAYLFDLLKHFIEVQSQHLLE